MLRKQANAYGGPMDNISRDLTPKEQEVFDMICQYPTISQDELAKRLNSTRSAVSVHISSLIKKKYIEGKGYIINKKNKVVIVGAAMIDIIGKSFNDIIPHDSNPGSINISAGGVSRNISENLARLDTHVTLITAICNDGLGAVVRDSCVKVGIDISDAYVVESGVTSTYLGILAPDGDMSLALSDTYAIDQIPLDFVKKKEHVLKSSELIVVDAVLPVAIMTYLLDHFPQQRIYLDPVSIGKARSVKHQIGKFYMIKCNRLEAEFLSDMTINNQDDVIKIANHFHQLGVVKVVITLGKDGVFYSQEGKQGFYQHRQVDIVNATGAGDAFMAGYIYGELQHYPIETTIKIASEMSAMALESQQTVNPNISIEKIKERIAHEFK